MNNDKKYKRIKFSYISLLSNNKLEIKIILKYLKMSNWSKYIIKSYKLIKITY